MHAVGLHDAGMTTSRGSNERFVANARRPIQLRRYWQRRYTATLDFARTARVPRQLFYCEAVSADLRGGGAMLPRTWSSTSSRRGRLAPLEHKETF